MKTQTKEAIIAGALFGLGLAHFSRAVELNMADYICHQEMVGFIRRDRAGGSPVYYKRCSNIFERGAGDEEEKD